ncbi:MAG: hypothetical protein M3Q69_09930, partial [Acidobacteriota bacterium]|nr:hypothetical protein [Acidobacteriota bacterium]
GAWSVAAQMPATATSLDLGVRAFRAGDYPTAIVALSAAANEALLPEAFENYVATGHFADLQQFETALVYLALSQFRMNHEDDARATIHRLLDAERLVPTYANLPLQNDATDFETLVAALVPDAQLAPNTLLAADDPSRALPAVRPLAQPATDGERAARQQLVETFRMREQDRAAGTQLATSTPTITEVPPATTSSVATATPSPTDAEIRAEADRRVAAAEAEAQRRIAAAEEEARQRIAAAEEQARRDAAAQAAAECAACAQRERERAAAETVIPQTTQTAQTPVPQEPAASERPAPVLTMPTLATTTAAGDRNALTTLREAEGFAEAGQLQEAASRFADVARSQNVSREVLAQAAIGLYRVGEYRDAAEAFRRIGTFGRGEEDLRYYHAVALYEVGEYEAAERELNCALPYIQLTEDVERYRLKIEQTAAVTNVRKF